MSVRLTKKQRKAIGDRFRAARHLARLTLKEVGEPIGAAPPTVFGYEHGIIPESPERRAKLAVVLGVAERVLYREVYELQASEDARARALLKEPA